MKSLLQQAEEIFPKEKQYQKGRNWGKVDGYNQSLQEIKQQLPTIFEMIKTEIIQKIEEGSGKNGRQDIINDVSNLLSIK